MSWIILLESEGYLSDAITHYNNAKDLEETYKPQIDLSKALSDSLNNLQEQYRLFSHDSSSGEIKTFENLVLGCMDIEAKNLLLESTKLNKLIYLDGQIMNHEYLRNHRYNPMENISRELCKGATKEHRGVVTSYERYQTDTSNEIREQLLKRLAELLYIVRSNIAHGNKTPRGPDLGKNKRDENVCEVVVPLQFLLINLLLDRPDQKLVSYGTLQPGKINHDVLDDIPGVWEECIIKGYLKQNHGLPYFTWRTDGEEIDAKMLTSPLLPEKWDDLDRFEGSTYKRRLILVKKRVGISIANIYKSADNMEES